MKLFEFVGLVNVSIAEDLKVLKACEEVQIGETI
jgi:hypothetical protein